MIASIAGMQNTNRERERKEKNREEGKTRQSKKQRKGDRMWPGEAEETGWGQGKQRRQDGARDLMAGNCKSLSEGR